MNKKEEEIVNSLKNITGNMVEFFKTHETEYNKKRKIEQIDTLINQVDEIK